VRLSPVALAHGGLTVEVKETPTVSQPGPVSFGDTVVVPRSEIKATETPGEVRQLEGAATLGDVVRALNALGVSPRDLVAILQGLKAVGALRAELEVL
jgi:flagellar P-ring protein precursor FlgI